MVQIIFVILLSLSLVAVQPVNAKVEMAQSTCTIRTMVNGANLPSYPIYTTADDCQKATKIVASSSNTSGVQLLSSFLKQTRQNAMNSLRKIAGIVFLARDSYTGVEPTVYSCQGENLFCLVDYESCSEANSMAVSRSELSCENGKGCCEFVNADGNVILTVDEEMASELSESVESSFDSIETALPAVGCFQFDSSWDSYDEYGWDIAEQIADQASTILSINGMYGVICSSEVGLNFSHSETTIETGGAFAGRNGISFGNVPAIDLTINNRDEDRLEALVSHEMMHYVGFFIDNSALERGDNRSFENIYSDMVIGEYEDIERLPSSGAEEDYNEYGVDALTAYVLLSLAERGVEIPQVIADRYTDLATFRITYPRHAAFAEEILGILEVVGSPVHQSTSLNEENIGNTNELSPSIEQSTEGQGNDSIMISSGDGTYQDYICGSGSVETEYGQIRCDESSIHFNQNEVTGYTWCILPEGIGLRICNQSGLWACSDDENNICDYSNL